MWYYKWTDLEEYWQAKTEKIANGIAESKLKFIGKYYTNVTFMGKTLKLIGFVMNRTQNLFGKD